MTYTKRVREYCKNHRGTLIDVSKVKDEEFSDIQYKTLLKILNRLEEENIVHTVSKGVYSIGELKSGNQPNVLKQYTADGKEMIVGYMLYHKIGITNYHSPVTEIYTNAMKSAHKNIENYHLTRVDLTFTDDVIEMVALLEVLKRMYNIIDCNIFKIEDAIKLLLPIYSDSLFRKVISEIKYPFSVAYNLNKRLQENNIQNNCVNVYNEVYG